MHHHCTVQELVAICVQLKEAFQQPFLVLGAGVEDHFAAALKQIGHAPVFSQISSVLAEGQS